MKYLPFIPPPKKLIFFSMNNILLLMQIVRLLANHPYFDITLMTADRKAGQSIGSVFPHLATQVCIFSSVLFVCPFYPSSLKFLLV